MVWNNVGVVTVMVTTIAISGGFPTTGLGPLREGPRGPVGNRRDEFSCLATNLIDEKIKILSDVMLAHDVCKNGRINPIVNHFEPATREANWLVHLTWSLGNSLQEQDVFLTYFKRRLIFDNLIHFSNCSSRQS